MHNESAEIAVVQQVARETGESNGAVRSQRTNCAMTNQSADCPRHAASSASAVHCRSGMTPGRAQLASKDLSATGVSVPVCDFDAMNAVFDGSAVE